MCKLLTKENNEKRTILPLIGTQLAVWIADKFTKHHNTFIVAHFIEINDEINIKLLTKSIIKVIKEADTLNMSFNEIENNPIQFLSSKNFNFPKIYDLKNQNNPKKIAYQLMYNDISSNIDILKNDSLLNQMLIHINYKCWYWYQRYHHLLIDGFSFFTITQRISDVYNSLIQKKIPNLTPFISFKMVIDEYKVYKQSSDYINDNLFWIRKCSNLPPLVSLSLKHTNRQSTINKIIRNKISIKFSLIKKIIDSISIKQLNMVDVISSLIAIWLARLSGQTNFTVGFACMRRIGSIALCSTGPMVNILPMEIQYNPQEVFSKLVSKISNEIKTIKYHQRYDIEQIHNSLKRNIYNNPFFSIIINFKIFEDELTFNGIQAKTYHLISGPVHDMEIMIYINTKQKTILIEILANANLYTYKNLKQNINRFKLILKQIITKPKIFCCNIDILTKNEKLRFKKINQTEHFIPRKTLDDLLKEQIKRTPNNLALIDSNYSFTYVQMYEQVQKLMFLLKKENIIKSDIIGVALTRSVFLSIALQSIIKLGGIYLPLDINYPNERLKLMLKDSCPKIIITNKKLSLRFNNIIPNIKQLHYDDLLNQKNILFKKINTIDTKPSLQDGIYLIYTSGSTGKPKGVIISHNSLVNRLLWMKNTYSLNKNDVILQKTSCSFDVSVWELFLPLIIGAKLIMPPSNIYHQSKILKELIINYKITTLHFVPSMLSSFIEEIKIDSNFLHNCKSLKQVFCSGEALSIELVNMWNKLTNVKLYNLYGPTEATIDVSHYRILNKKKYELKQYSSIPIGCPVWNTKFKVLDANLQQVPPGILGELYISGIQLAYGYLNKPSITAARFIADPEGNGTRMYRTGDVVRWTNDDVIEYIRRSDDQIKIRGQRIELNEINQVLNSIPNIIQSTTKVYSIQNELNKKENNKQLISYVIANDDINLEKIKIQLIKKLPIYMVPISIIKLKQFPLNDNGKIDLKSLPFNQTNSDNRLPFPGLESSLAKIFSKILKCNQIYAKDDFFALGGNSLLAMQLISKLNKFINKPLSISDILIASTIEKLAIFIKENSKFQKINKNIAFSTVLPFRISGNKILFCFHPASGFAWQYSMLLKFLDKNWSLIGIQSPTLYGPLNQSKHFDEICDHHMKTLLKQQPKGPYYFIGYSLGGILAQNIASKLENLGETIAFLGLLDTWPPEIQNWKNNINKKKILDPNILQEINREKNEFLSIKNQKNSKDIEYVFEIVEHNYASSVRLLAKAHSLKLNSYVTLFSATKTSQNFEKNIREAWLPYIKNLNIFRLNCTHVEIMSQAIFSKIGTIINKILAQI